MSYRGGVAGATGDNPFGLETDLNGNTIKLPTASQYPNDKVEFNWDNKLRKAWKGDNSIHVKYDPMGNRVWKQTSDGVNTAARKFIVDINSQLPVVLCVVDGADPNLLTSSYYYADAQVVHQRHHTDPADPNIFDPSYYVHDRLGSVRLVVVPEYDQQQQAWVVLAANSYTYTPYGQLYPGHIPDAIDNPWKFTGQWHDVEIDQYHLRARQYDPVMMRFTSRDPENIYFQEPLTINKYVYCFNNPALYVDPAGEFGVVDGIIAGYQMHMTAVGVAAAGVEMGNWDVILFGAFLDTMITPAILHGMLSARNNKSSIDDALDMGAGWVGKGYKEIAPGVFRSADGTKIFRITDSCITGKHGGGPHVVFEWIDDLGEITKEHLKIY